MKATITDRSEFNGLETVNRRTIDVPGSIMEKITRFCLAVSFWALVITLPFYMIWDALRPKNRERV